MQERREIAQQYVHDNKIVGYKLNGNRLIYYANSDLPTENTVKITVRLNTLQEERQKLNYRNKKGDLNKHKYTN